VTDKATPERYKRREDYTVYEERREDYTVDEGLAVIQAERRGDPSPRFETDVYKRARREHLEAGGFDANRLVKRETTSTTSCRRIICLQRFRSWARTSFWSVAARSPSLGA
jgi:hypothetical protein